MSRLPLSRGRDVSVLPSWWRNLALWQRRAVKTIIAVLALVLLSSVLYHYVIIVFEGKSPTFPHSLQVVIETYTGTGYGADAPWDSTVANLLVSVMDLSTFLILFIVLPYVLRPVLEEALSPTIPHSVDMSEHVVICGIQQQARRLIKEFDARDVDYVVIVSTEEEAIDLTEDDIPVLHGDPTEASTLHRACVESARSVVIDTEERYAASVVLALRECNEQVRAIVLVENLDHERQLRYAGADSVITPRHVLGRRIADRIRTEISPTRSATISIDDGPSVLELVAFEESPIEGHTVGAIEENTDQSVTVLGLVGEDGFVTTPPAEAAVDEDTVLILAGPESELRSPDGETHQGQDEDPHVIIAGYGIVGGTVHDSLRQTACDCTVVDIEDGPDVDVVGDVTDLDTLERANISEAKVFVVTISDDHEAILAVLLADKIASDLDIIVRMNEAGNEAKVRRAGADYVLSLPEMSGRVLAEEVLNEDVLTFGQRMKSVRIDGSRFAGQSIGETGIGVPEHVLVAVQRGDELLTEVSEDLELRADDEIFVVGDEEDLPDEK